MKDFQLNNLRELSIEEQLHLNGGAAPQTTNCSKCTCSCEKEGSDDNVKDAKDAVKQKMNA